MPARTITVRRSAETARIEVRRGEVVVGRVMSPQLSGATRMSGRFEHAPAFADHVDQFRALAEAVAAGDEAATAGARAEIERKGLHVRHTQHDMRIDRPGSLTIAKGEATFEASDAFLMMRSGGLG